MWLRKNRRQNPEMKGANYVRGRNSNGLGSREQGRQTGKQGNEH